MGLGEDQDQGHPRIARVEISGSAARQCGVESVFTRSAARLSLAAFSKRERAKVSRRLNGQAQPDRTVRRQSRNSQPLSDTRLKRSALPMTETELKLIAAAAIIGLSRIPKKG